jgi:hypothetical protein
MKKTILKQLIKVALFSVCATSIAQAQLPVADVAPETVTLQCHNADINGLASMIINIRDSKYAFSSDFNTREVVLGPSLSLYMFDGYVANPSAVRESVDKILETYVGSLSGREGSNRLQNIPGSVFYTDEKKGLEVTVRPITDEKDILARVSIKKNGSSGLVLMKCQTWNGK